MGEREGLGDVGQPVGQRGDGVQRSGEEERCDGEEGRRPSVLTLVSHPTAPSPVVLAFAGRELNAVIMPDVRHDTIDKIHVVADPQKMALLDAQLTPAD